jgi:polyhydroxybutyrate depolymerase
MRIEMSLACAICLAAAAHGCVTNGPLFDELPESEGVAGPFAGSLEPAAAAADDRGAGGQETVGSEPGGQLAPVGAVAQAAAEPGCEAGILLPGDTTFELSHAGRVRRYHVHVPSDYAGTRPVPALIDLHGTGSTALEQAGLSGWREKADAVGFIAVYPEALGGSWNAGPCCDSSLAESVDDEGFIRALVARLQQDACVDPARIYATGISTGGAMAHLLACRAADLFAATAPVAMGRHATPCEPVRPISVVMARGILDVIAPFDDSSGPGAVEAFVHWRDLNGCRGLPQRVAPECERFEDCAGGVEVMACTLLAAQQVYENIQSFSVPDAAWAVFERQPLR